MVIEMKTNKKISIIRNVIFTLLVVGCCVGVTSYAITFYNDRNHSDLGGDAEATDTNDSAEGMANGTADSTANGIVSGSEDDTANSNADDTAVSYTHLLPPKKVSETRNCGGERFYTPTFLYLSLYANTFSLERFYT